MPYWPAPHSGTTHCLGLAVSSVPGMKAREPVGCSRVVCAAQAGCTPAPLAPPHTHGKLERNYQHPPLNRSPFHPFEKVKG